MIGYPDRALHRIGRAAATQEWHDVTMLHWRVAPSVIAGLLPGGLVPDTFDGSAWVSLVPFRMVDLTIPPLPALPWSGTFPETNVRTYVTGPAGPAVWFLSLDVTRAFMPPVARTLFGVPYTWSRMAITRRDDEIRYWCRRRFPPPVGASSHVGVRIGGHVQPDDLDRWLTNRWGAYSTIRSTVWFTPVEHSPWRPQVADLVLCRDELAAAVGVPLGEVERVRYARLVVDIRFDRPQQVSVEVTV